mgnify:CR=1 FL=1
MGMAAWGWFITPLVAYAQAPVPEQAEVILDTPAAVEGDIFGEFAPLNATAMSAASGGSDTAIDINDIAVNIADSDGSISGVTTTNSDTGDIANNIVSDNRGITTVFNNTGNGVIFQSTVNVNVFLDGAGQ